MTLCECGCGQETKIYRGKSNRYILGHTGFMGKPVWNKGKKMSEEFCKKNSESHLGKYPSEEHKRKLSIAKEGKHNSEEHNKNIGKAIIGENHWNWQGGKSFEIYPQEFNNNLRIQVRTNYNNCCRLCGTVCNKTKLSIHHIDYNKENNAPENLIPLCKSCHGVTNYNRPKWIKFFARNKDKEIQITFN